MPTTTIRTRTPTPKFGFYGCSVKGVVVRLTYAEPRRAYPRTLELTCPACGECHDVALMWRAATPYDEDREADLVLCD